MGVLSGERLATHARPFSHALFFPCSVAPATVLRQSPNSVQRARNSDRLFDLSCGFRATQLSNSQNHSCMKFLAEDFNSLKHIYMRLLNSFSPSPQQSLHRRKAI